MLVAPHVGGRTRTRKGICWRPLRKQSVEDRRQTGPSCERRSPSLPGRELSAAAVTSELILRLEIAAAKIPAFDPAVAERYAGTWLAEGATPCPWDPRRDNRVSPSTRDWRTAERDHWATRGQHHVREQPSATINSRWLARPARLPSDLHRRHFSLRSVPSSAPCPEPGAKGRPKLSLTKARHL
jgi:hypothetical protein